MKKRLVFNQLPSYLIVSGIAALVNFLSRFVYDIITNFEISLIMAYYTGLIFNFSLSKIFVFNSNKSGKTAREFIKFFLVASGGVIALYIASVFVFSLSNLYFTFYPIHLRKSVAHIIGIGVGFIINFVGHKFFSFRSSGLWKFITKKIS